MLPSGDAIRPGPFPAYGSPAWQAELAAVRAATAQRTLAQERIIDSWLNAGSWGFYDAYALDLIERNGLGEVEAAGVLAMLSVATYDTFVAVWDGKYHYWIARPISIVARSPATAHTIVPIRKTTIPPSSSGRRP